MPFDYYHSLSKRNKKIYDASAAIAFVELSDETLTRAHATAARLIPALGADKRLHVAKISNQLAHDLCDGFHVPTVPVVVRNVRPSNASGELHGLYTRHDDGRCKIEVWMRTAQKANVVAWKTYLRTLLHEILHHLDYVHYALGDSLHTEGFFKRESDLVRKLTSGTTAPKPPKPAKTPKPVATKLPPPATKKQQLSFGF